jgi:transposase-like protein
MRKEKVAILRRHFLDKVPVSDLCDELGLQPTVFYRWQKEFFENGAAVFQGKSFLEKKIQTQRRGAGRTDGRAYRVKKSLGEL